MKLRTELEPQIEVAEKLYPQILELIENYEKFVDENGDQDEAEYKRVEALLGELSGKDMSLYSFWETCEEEGNEVLAFRLSLPKPLKTNDITKDEITEVVSRICESEFPEGDSDSFADLFAFHISDYYHELLELNCDKYKYKLFLRQKDGSSLTVSEIVTELV